MSLPRIIGTWAKLRHWFTESLIKQDLPGSIVDMVVAADYRGYIHTGIVNNNDEVVGRRAVGSLDNQVIELFVIK